MTGRRAARKAAKAKVNATLDAMWTKLRHVPLFNECPGCLAELATTLRECPYCETPMESDA